MNNNLPSEAVAHAVAVLKNEHVIAYPTEAVFGVGCDPDSETAVMRLLELKQRPVEKGLILIAASFEQLKPYIDDSRLSDSQREAIFSCWPGPVTFVFPARPETPRWLTGRFDSLAVRVTKPSAGNRIVRSLRKTTGFDQRQSHRATTVPYYRRGPCSVWRQLPGGGWRHGRPAKPI
ncbi:putative ribosome maturation factor [Klebsiella pneumoniae]|uniref:L-threonylcarbamoyladenylate synthase n=1 Tax=Klebsiella pneumoniae TaxID=573 RepID=A0A378A3J8_KLEPN|nr:putative ribosome maturation factor [Klebsiella pneumoniae]